MKYASEALVVASVHEWKPITPEQFADLTHLYATVCSAPHSGDHGNEGMCGLWPHAYKLDRTATAVFWYMPKGGQAPDCISSPVLLTITRSDGKVMCFKSLVYGLDTYGLGTKPTVLTDRS